MIPQIKNDIGIYHIDELWQVNKSFFGRRENIMNYRISKKIYKRADFKLKSFIAANYDRRTTYDIAKEENVLSGLEYSIFISKQDKWAKRINNIVDELKVEEQIMDEEMQR
jgi:hypothetical protein